MTPKQIESIQKRHVIGFVFSLLVAFASIFGMMAIEPMGTSILTITLYAMWLASKACRWFVRDI